LFQISSSGLLSKKVRILYNEYRKIIIQTMKTKKIILIGGAPTTGKSTMAALVAKHLNLPWISTDQIRETMRLVARREDYPKLFNIEGYDAQKFLTEFSASEIADIELEQSEAVWVGIKKFIENDYTWKKGFVMEGVGILPHLVAKDFANNKEITSVFLVDEDADRIKDVIYNRGLWDDAKKYSDDLKPKEIEWVLDFSHKLRAEAEKYGYPTIEVQKKDTDLQAVLSTIAL
jgi:2-phosphoglycerate kinase